MVRRWEPLARRTDSMEYISPPESTVATSILRTRFSAPKLTSAARCVFSHPLSPILVLVRTGILGGTFDPIHIAHLHAAECALDQFDLDRVLLMPAGNPWQKSDRDISDSQHRVEMCRLAVEDVEGFFVDEREVVREGPTYTAETLATFEDDEEIFLILGSDALAGIHTWKRADEVLERVTVLMAPRPGDHVFDDAHANRIDMGLLDVSATDIRSRIEQGRPFRYLVTEPVYGYIRANDLYTKA